MGAANKASRHSLPQQALIEVKAFFLGTKLNVLMGFLILAVISKAAGWGDGATCALSMLALIPMAERLGFVTEELASYTNDSVGGLLNATFGNATELIISAFALKANLLRVVQLSLLGSVISNLLLVMGTAFVAGGILNPEQTFSKQAISIHCGLLMLSVVSVVLPSMLVATRSQSKEGHTRPDDPSLDPFPSGSSSLILSRVESILLFICYAVFLVFQLWSHKHLYEEEEDEEAGGVGHPSAAGAMAVEMVTQPSPERPLGRESVGGARTLSGRPGRTSLQERRHSHPIELPPPVEILTAASNGREMDDVPLLGARDGDPLTPNASTPQLGAIGRQSSLSSTKPALSGRPEKQVLAEPEEGDQPELSWPGCFIWMVLVTLVIALLSEWIVGAIEGASTSLGVPLPFLVTILLPIVGNAAEHASAIIFAVRNRIELALGVAVGSSTQVSVLLVPLCVLLAWAMGRPLDLNYSAFETAVLFFSVMLSIVVLQDGSSNYLKGIMLLLTYFFIAVGFWCHSDLALAAEETRRISSRLLLTAPLSLE